MPHESNEFHEHESSQYMMTKCLLNEISHEKVIFMNLVSLRLNQSWKKNFNEKINFCQSHFYVWQRDLVTRMSRLDLCEKTC